ncbi:hypothetical protein ACFE04_020407 [Oxalis oulophora]
MNNNNNNNNIWKVDDNNDDNFFDGLPPLPEAQQEGTSNMPSMAYAYGGLPRLDTVQSFNYSSQSVKSQVSLETPTTNTSHPLLDVERLKNEKKKQADKKYRIKLKEGKRKVVEDLDRFVEENKWLTVENDMLKIQKDEMYQGLQSAKAETKELRNQVCKLKGTIKVQETLVETFSHEVINDGREQEVAELKRKFDVMSKELKWENWMTEKEQLLKKEADLKHRNKLLKIQIEALCFKISNPTEVDLEEDDSESPRYYKFVTIRKKNITDRDLKDQTVELNDKDATVEQLCLKITQDLEFELDSFDLYYDYNWLKNDQKVEDVYEKFNIPNRAPLDVVDKAWLTVKRKDEDDMDYQLYVSPLLTVGELKSKLREMYVDITSEFQLQHPDQPDVNLKDEATMVSVGVGLNTTMLFGSEPEAEASEPEAEASEPENIESD